MSGRKHIKKTTKVLQNIPLESNNLLIKNLQKTPTDGNNTISSSSDKRTNTPKKNKNNNIVHHRNTASTYIFEEEPIFYDSDEETEYFNNILVDQIAFDSTKEASKKLDAEVQCTLISDYSEASKKVDAEVQCSLISDYSRIIDVINKCASFKDESNKELQKLIDHCKILQFKYKYVNFENAENAVARNETNAEHSNRTENEADKTITEKIIFIDGEKSLVPSRSGDSSGFSSDTVGFDAVSNIDSFIHSLDSFTENKTVRRSCRTRKCIEIGTIGTFIVKKDRKKPLRESKFNLKNNTRNNKTTSERLIGHKEKLEKCDKKIQRKIKNSIGEMTEIFVRNKKNGRQISKVSARALARNWKNPSKHREGCRISVGNAWESSQNQIQARRLYTPDDWLHSRELTALCKLNEKI